MTALPTPHQRPLGSGGHAVAGPRPGRRLALEAHAPQARVSSANRRPLRAADTRAPARQQTQRQTARDYRTSNPTHPTPALPTTKPPPSPAENTPQHQPTHHPINTGLRTNIGYRRQSPTRPGAVLRGGTELPPRGASAAISLPHSPLTHTHPRTPTARRSICRTQFQRRRQLTSPADIRPPSFRTHLRPGPDTPRQPSDFLPHRTPLDPHRRTQRANPTAGKKNRSRATSHRNTNAQYRTESANCRAALGLAL